MRVGILSFHNAANYGAVLQSYALSTIIKLCGADAAVINYRSKCIEASKARTPLSRYRNPISYVRDAIVYKQKRLRNELFEAFINEALPLTAPTEKERLGDISHDFDVIISGSDQVWNHNITGGDQAFLLDFADKHVRKCAYAASFGFSQLKDEYVDQYKQLLSEYSIITVREESGKKIITDRLELNADVVIDPSLLLDEQQWKSQMHYAKRETEPFILLYMLVWSESLIKFAEDLLKKTGMRIIAIVNTPKNISGVETRHVVAVQEWLALFEDSSYVVTNSFHGVAFSLNFKKEFFVEYLKSGIDANSRITDILRVFDLESRLIADGAPLDNRQSVNWEAVNKKLSDLREESINMLRKMIDA